MSTSPRLPQKRGFPGLTFPNIYQQPFTFIEPPNFNSPELSARMDQTIRTSRLNDFKLLQKQPTKGAQSLTSRNAKHSMVHRTKQPTSLISSEATKNQRKHLNSVNQHPIADFMNSGRSSNMKSSHAVGKSVDQKSTALRTTTIQESTVQQMQQSLVSEPNFQAFQSTERNGFNVTSYRGQKASNIIMRNQANETFTAGETVLSNSRGSPMVGQTTQNWNRNRSLGPAYMTSADFGNKRETNPISSAGRSGNQSVDEPRLSIMSDSVNVSKLMATRVPYRQGMGSHSFRLSTKEMNFNKQGAPDAVSNFSVSKNAPMSPGARQRLALDKIHHMTQRARGQLLPGQPTAKAYAQQLKEQRALTCPQDFGDEAPFVHNTTGKPITTYKYEKFKEVNRLRGIELDQKVIQQEMAQKMAKRRSMAKHEKSMFERKKGMKNIIKFQSDQVDLYTEEDKKRLAKGLRPELKVKDSDQSVDEEGTEETCDGESSIEDDSTLSLDPGQGMTEEDTQRLLQQLKANVNLDAATNANLTNTRRHKKYDLWGGKKTLDEFKTVLMKQIKKKDPEVNIAEIAEQFFHREVKEGPAAQSSNVIFKKTLQQERIKYFDLNNKNGKMRHPHEKPLFHLTKDPLGERSASPMRKINEEKQSDESKPTRFFTLHRYTLQELQQAYQAYYKVHKSIVYAAAESKRYKKLKDAEEIKILETQVVKEIRQNPKMEHIAKIIEDPLTHALIRMLITYEKYNFEPEEFGVGKAMNQSRDDLNEEETMFSDARPYKEIELMKELVIEFGSAIDERIREDDGQPATPVKDSPRRDIASPKNSDTDGQPQLESLSGHKLRKQAKKNTYMQIDRYIAEHPEFELIKEDAKQKLLSRIQKYKENSVAGDYGTPNITVVQMSPGIGDSQMSSPVFRKEPLRPRQEPNSPQESKLTELKTPLGSNSQYGSTFEPRRRSVPKRSKLTLQQFVQSTHFQDAFTELIKTLDNQYKKRREQTKQAAQYINKHVFYQLAKDSITNNAAENPNIEYMNTCYDKNVMPFPIFSKISGNMLKLVGYYLNDGYCQALQKYLTQQTTQEALIEKLVLHGNNCSDESFGAILTGCLTNSKLRHLHYSLNNMGHKSNEVLQTLLQVKFPNQLESLILSNLNTTGKTLKQEKTVDPEHPIEEGKEPETPPYIKEIETMSKKVNVVHQLTINLLETESLHKLVLQDLNLGDRAQQNIVLFVQQNQKLENLQLINCQMMPEHLATICKELETQQGLVNLSFRKNVMPFFTGKVKQKADKFAEWGDNSGSQVAMAEFVDNMTSLIANAPALMHLDISGMFIGDVGIKQILCEGVAESKTLAAVHFQDNKVSHWLRLSIYVKLKRKTKSQNPSRLAGAQTSSFAEPRPRESSGLRAHSILSFDPHASFDLSDYESSQNGNSRPGSAKSKESNISLKEQKGLQKLVNAKRTCVNLDKKLDKDEIEEELLLKNISEMVKANMPIINFPESQMIVDADILKEKKADQYGVEMENIKGGLAQELLGTLYSRVSHTPSLYQDKVERDKYFAKSKWLSVSYHTGCWICNSNKIIDRMSKKTQSNYVSHYEKHVKKSIDFSEI